MLATYAVTNLQDAPVFGPGEAPGTLRQAVFDANSTTEADLIEFAPGLSGDIQLSVIGDIDPALGPSALLVSSAITIRGNANGIMISRAATATDRRLFHVTSTGNLTLDLISLRGGTARGATASPGADGGNGLGGAVFNQGNLHVVASTLYDNQAIGGNASSGRGGSGRGGAIYNEAGTVSIVNSTLSGNTAQSGSGTAVPSSFGAGIYSLDGPVTIDNSTITNSTATSGRQLYVLALSHVTVQIRSSILGQANLPASGYEFVAAADTNAQLTVSGGNNLIRSQNDYQSITVSSDDPLLASLANNGGPTLTHMPLEGSPTINAGSNPTGLPTDQRGTTYARAVGGQADIGAFEVQTMNTPSLPGDYNRNHDVDAADFVLWRKTSGSSVPQYSDADGNGNGTVDDADYPVWHDNFGAAEASTAVAMLVSNEPATEIQVLPVTVTSALKEDLKSIRLLEPSNRDSVPRNQALASRSFHSSTSTARIAAHDEALLSMLTECSRHAPRAVAESADAILYDPQHIKPTSTSTSNSIRRSLLSQSFERTACDVSTADSEVLR
jgi:hypothetical protein